MQRRPGGGDPFFDFPDPFAGLGRVGNLGGQRSQRSLVPSFFGGNSLFDDPFFTRPFGSMFKSSFFGPVGSPFAEMPMIGFPQNQPSQSINRHTGPVIEEINSDDENEEETKAKNGNPRKHSRSSKEPYIKEPDDAVEGRRNKHVQLRNNSAWVNQSQTQPQPQSHSYSFQSSTVTYGGSNGAYYTSSRTRRAGNDGLSFEESKEADTTSGRASHRISRGIHDKGHSLVRNLNSNGKVDTTQTLLNIDEDQLAGFEAAWEKNAGKHLPGWNQGAGVHGNSGFCIGHSHSHEPNSGGWALPSTSRPVQEEWNNAGSSSHPQQSKSKKVARRQ